MTCAAKFAEDMLAVLQTKVERFGVDIKARQHH